MISSTIGRGDGDIRRREYLKLYEMTTKVDPETGRDKRVVRYIGPWFSVLNGETRRTGGRSLILFLLSAAAYVAAAFQNPPGSRCFYVLPFFLFELFPLFYWVYGAVRTLLLKPRFTAVDKDESLDRIKASALGAAILSGLHTLGEIVFLILGQAGERASTELFCAGMLLLVGLCACLTLLDAKRLAIVREEPAGGKNGDC